MISDEVDKLLWARFIIKVLYPQWLANAILIKNLIKIKEYMLITSISIKHAQRITILFLEMVSHELLFFMDTFLGYNQIRMESHDQEHTSFIID